MENKFIKTIYVDDTNRVTIICPQCGIEKNFDVTNFKDTHKKLKAKCRCGEVFRLTLEFRKYFRKNVRFAGEYFFRETDEKGEILIEDISLTGINFATLKPHHFYKNDMVELKFTLDNPMKTRVQKLVKIMWTKDHAVGAQFNDPKSLEKDFGVYLKE